MYVVGEREGERSDRRGSVLRGDGDGVAGSGGGGGLCGQDTHRHRPPQHRVPRRAHRERAEGSDRPHCRPAIPPGTPRALLAINKIIKHKYMLSVE